MTVHTHMLKSQVTELHALFNLLLLLYLIGCFEALLIHGAKAAGDTVSSSTLLQVN